MVVETLCHTDVSIPRLLHDDVVSLFPGVTPDIAVRNMAIMFSQRYHSKINPNADYPYLNLDPIVFPPDDESEIWRPDTVAVRVFLPVRVINRLTLIVLESDPGQAVVMSIASLLTELARSGWRR